MKLRPTSELPFRPRALPLAMLIAAVATSALNYLISILGISLGAPASQQQLTPPVFIGVSVLISIVGAVGWLLVVRAVRNPQATLRWLVPVVFVLSFLPDLGLTLATHPPVGALVTLAVMHVATIAIAVTVYLLLMPPRAKSVAVAAAGLSEA